MWRETLYFGLSIYLMGTLLGCSDVGPVPFPPGLGEDDAGASNAPAPDAVAPDSGTASLEDEHDVSEDPPPDASSSAFPNMTDAEGGCQDAALEAAPSAVIVDAAPEVSQYEPAVVIISPLDGAVVQNPVTFEIAARNVTYVRLMADQYPLSEPWDPYTDSTLQFNFIGVNYPREIQLVGLDANHAQLTTFTITITVVD